jgi:hypothetical protein
MRYKLALALFSSILLTAPLALAQGRGSFAAPSRGNSNHHGGDGGFNMFPSPSNQVFAVPAWLTGAGPRPNRNNDFNGRRGNSFGIGYYPAAGYYPAIYPSYYDGQPNYGPDYTNASQGQIVVLEPRNLSESQSSREALLERRLDDQARELDRIRQEKSSAPKTDSASAASNDGEELQPTTILVFKDKRNLELVHNYAIVGSNLFVMGRNHRKIPLADLDLPATARANEEAGLEFKMPGTPTAKLHSGLGIER